MLGSRTTSLQNGTHISWINTSKAVCLSYLNSMRKIRTFSAMVFLVTLLLIFFYSTLPLDTTHSYRTGKEDIPPSVQAKIQVKDKGVTTQHSVQKNITLPQVQLQDVTLSKDFRDTFSLQKAYWNRLLYLTLVKLDRGESPQRWIPDWSHCRETNQERIQTNVYNFNLYPTILKNFVLGMSCRTPSMLINQPKKCRPSSEEKEGQKSLLFAIKSTPGNFEQRQTVRETWGREGLNISGVRVHTVFLIGSFQEDDPDLSQLLSFEAQFFGDILQWDFHESFLNLTLKMYVSLQWMLNYCNNVTFVFSGDDDVFVNTPKLLEYLHSLDPSKASHLYGGQVIKTASPIRDSKSKYYIPQSFYEGGYPTYVAGGGFIISGALLRPLYSVSHLIPFFPIDDVYIGMCFHALGITPQEHTDFRTFDIKADDRENLCVHKNLILTHKRFPQQIKKLWRGIHSPLLAC